MSIRWVDSTTSALPKEIRPQAFWITSLGDPPPQAVAAGLRRGKKRRLPWYELRRPRMGPGLGGPLDDLAKEGLNVIKGQARELDTSLKEAKALWLVSAVASVAAAIGVWVRR